MCNKEIDEAIKELKAHSELNLVDKNPKLRKAMRLGIEALERLEQYRYSIIIGLEERIRINEIEQAIILVGEQGIDGLVFNDWWTAFRQKLSSGLLPSETQGEK